MKKLSIIIPTYNVEEYIIGCLESLVPQLNNWCELIIVDDCSTDKTVEIVDNYLNKVIRKAEWDRSYAIQDEYIRPEHAMRIAFSPVIPWTAQILTSTINQGVSAARNRGLATATGEYIAFIDGDDYVTEDYIAAICDAIRKEEHDLYEISWRSFGANNKLRTAGNLPESNCSVWSRVWKRTTIKYLFDETMRWSEDRKFLTQNAVRGLSIGYIMTPIYMYRRGRQGSLMTAKGKINEQTNED